MWHVSSRSGVATLRTAIHLLLTYYTVSQPRIGTARVYSAERGLCITVGCPSVCPVVAASA